MSVERAEAAREAARKLGDTLYEKQMAYGDSGALALALWEARLQQYLNPEGTHYVIPRALIAHLPRITRLDDRINRIVSNPAGDRLGEDPWRDAAGDCIIGMIMPRVREGRVPAQSVPVEEEHCWEPECERGRHTDGLHRRVHAGGMEEWKAGMPKRRVELMDEIAPLTPATFTHGYVPEDDA